MRMPGFPIRRSSTLSGASLSVLILALAAAAAPDSEALASTITVQATDCHRLVRHQPSADVAYKPGVDVNGNAVAPADLPGSVSIKTPTEITFDVTYDLLSNFGVSENSALLPRGEAALGTVKYDLLSGALTFNGERLDDADTAALAELCRAADAQ